MAKMSDSELLAIVKDEAQRSIGFEYDNELKADRERALNYRKGQMDDLPALPNRSKAVSTDVADAIETLLPDLVDIFTSGDDVATFQPVGPEDEEAAKQETDYLNHVFFNENSGKLILYTMFKDACESKTGVVKWGWEEYEQPDEVFEGKNEDEAGQIVAAMQARQGEVKDLTNNEDGTVDITVSYPAKGKACIYSVPPEDFTVARDTKLQLADATYCAMRARRRAQDLIVDGIDREVVERLPAYSSRTDETIDQARDTAGEDEFTNAGGLGDLREVEIVEHYIRVDVGDGLKLYRVVTGGNESILVEREEVEAIPFAAITPYIVTHRFYGESVADKLMELQKISTALLRMFLDSGYFALNQRNEVAMERANQWTVSDLLRNEPGVPVRSKTGDAVRPITSGGLDFDGLAALEYMATQAEKRTGIVRNAQGLNPDTLHDTARGAQALMNASQKRIKLIAWIFAETGVKALFLGLHAMIRKHATAEAKFRRGNKWISTDPTQWGERNDMTIEVGAGAAGREIELGELTNILSAQKEVIQLQGGTSGPFVTAENLSYALKRYVEKSNQKNPDAFFSDPKDQPPQPPKPDPEMLKLQQQQQTDQAKLQLQQQGDQAKMQMQAQQSQQDYQLRMMQAEGELQLKRDIAEQELQMKRELLQAELDLKREELTAKLALQAQSNARDANRADYEASASVSSDVRPGGDPG